MRFRAQSKGSISARGRIDWMHVLALELADPGFDSTVLSEFRSRLVAGQAERLLLDRLVGASHSPELQGRLFGRNYAQTRFSCRPRAQRDRYRGDENSHREYQAIHDCPS
jgi:hypothetical protein